MASIFDTLKQKQGDVQKSASWYRNAVKSIQTSITAGRLMRENKLINRPSAGRLNLFMYDPKTKDRLPLYDIVPLVLLAIDDQLVNYKSCIVNTVHDSIVIDVHPSEERLVLDIINSVNKNMKTIIDNSYGIDFNVPLLLEAKMGDNWLDTKDVS